jgi:hypothetical protein
MSRCLEEFFERPVIGFLFIFFLVGFMDWENLFCASIEEEGGCLTVEGATYLSETARSSIGV